MSSRTSQGRRVARGSGQKKEITISAVLRRASRASKNWRWSRGGLKPCATTRGSTAGRMARIS